MYLTNKNMYKMSEASITVNYSKYLQEVFIAEMADKADKAFESNKQDFLSYEDFKDYYILKLVGKESFVDKLVHKMQHNNIY